MSNKDKKQFEQYQNLTRRGIELQQYNQIRPNGGSETFKHLVAKCAVAHIAINNGYKVASEVEISDGSEIDILMWGKPDSIVWAVECETSPTEDVKQDKLTRYVKSQPGIDDMVLINVSEMPAQLVEALGYVANQLGMVE